MFWKNRKTKNDRLRRYNVFKSSFAKAITVVIYDGKLKQLKREKDDAKEVKNSYECGMMFENFDDIKEGDVVECFEKIEKQRMID